MKFYNILEFCEFCIFMCKFTYCHLYTMHAQHIYITKNYPWVEVTMPPLLMNCKHHWENLKSYNIPYRPFVGVLKISLNRSQVNFVIFAKEEIEAWRVNFQWKPDIGDVGTKSLLCLSPLLYFLLNIMNFKVIRSTLCFGLLDLVHPSL